MICVFCKNLTKLPICWKHGTGILTCDGSDFDLSPQAIALSEVETGKQRADLELYRNRGTEIDLVILDLGMPGMGGHQCFKELLHLNPDIRVIIASGYPPGTPENDLLAPGKREFVGKPYQAENLLAAVRKELER